MSTPLTLATRAHPLALSVYAGQLVLGVLYLTGVARAAALTSFVDPRFAALWAAGLTIGALVALTAVLARRGRLSTVLLAEATGALTLAVANATYLGSLLGGDVRAPTTIALVAGVAVGSAARAAQCVREVCRATAAAARPAPADPPPLAEVDRSGEG